jgi:UV DNA damage endonuclease
MRLGFAVKVLGQPGLKSNDTRRWQNNPHLSVSLAYLRDIFEYLHQIQVHMYRMSSDLAPYVTHPDLPQFHRQIQECAGELEALGRLAREYAIRLSLHPSAYVVLNSPDRERAARAIVELETQAELLDRMGLGSEAVIVVHAGGLYDGKQASMIRFSDRYRQLSESAQSRLVLENDERMYTIRDIYAIHEQTGIRLVADQLHQLCNPAPGIAFHQALSLALGTWPIDQVPKIHFSTPRSTMIVDEGRDASGRLTRSLRQPRLSRHADLIDPFAFIDLLRGLESGRPFDVMLECKGKDLALLRLRQHLSRFAPDLVARLQIT